MSNEREIQRESFLDKIDTTLIGFILGLIIPMLMLVLLYVFKFKSEYHYTWDTYINSVKQLSTLPSFIRNCVFLNLPFFFLFNLLKRFNLCKGIFIASVLYLIAMLVVRYAL